MAQLKDLIVNGPSRFVGNITANDSFTLGGPLTASGGSTLASPLNGTGAKVISETIASLIKRIESLEDSVDSKGDLSARSITSSTVYKINNDPLFRVSSETPSTAPDFIGQLLIVNTSNPKLYYSFGDSSSSDWTFLLDNKNYSDYAVNLKGVQTITGNKTFNSNVTFNWGVYHTSTLFMGSGSDGIYLTSNSINWHNPNNVNQGSLFSFSSSSITSYKSIYPSSDNALYLGDSGHKWNNIYTQNANIASLNVSSSLTIGGVTLTASNGILTISGLVLALNGLTSATALSESSGTGSIIFNGPWSDYSSEKSDYALAASLGYDLNTRVTSLEGKATNVKFTQVIAAGKQIGTISIDGASTNLYAPSNYAWSEITSKPTTIAGFGITDAYTKTTIDSKLSIYMPITGGVLDSPELYSNGGNYTFIGNPNNDSWVVVREDMCGPKESSETWFIETDGTAVFSTINGSLSRSLTIKLNGGTTEGTNLFTFDNSASKTINITPSAIGAAVASHSHSYLPLAGGTMSNTNVVTNLNADLLDGWHADDFVKSHSYNADDLTRFTNKAFFQTSWVSGIGDFGTLVIPTWIGNNNSNYYTTELRFPIGSFNPIIRCTHNDDTTDWKTIALVSDNVASASKWANARTITLTGSVTGSVSIDGSGDVSLATTTNHTHTFASLTSKPTTISGYGITDAYTKTQTDTKLSGYLPLTGGTLYSNNSSTVLNLKAPGSAVDSIIRFSDATTSEIYEILLRRPTTSYGLQCNINGNYYNLIHSGNYNSYAPKLDGTGASGTWGINISGNADTLNGFHASSFKREWTTLAGGPYYTGWVRIMKWKLTNVGYFSPHPFILTLYREYASPATETYTLSFNFGWGSANIVQLNGNAGGRIIERFRISATPDRMTYYLEYYVNPNYNTYLNTCYCALSSYYSLDVELINEVASDSTTTIAEITTKPNYIVGNVEGSATKLQTARTIWGHSFDGTGDVSGELSGVTNINSALYINSSGNVTIGGSDLAGTNAKLYVDGTIKGGSLGTSALEWNDSRRGLCYTGTGITGWVAEFGNGNNGVLIGCRGASIDIAAIGAVGSNRLSLNPDGGNVGIGTADPQYKLDVAGTGRFTGAVTMASTLTVEQSVTSKGFFTSGDYGLWKATSFGSGYTDNDIVLYGSIIGIGGNIRPHSNNAYTLGTSSYQWSHLYAVGATFSGNVNINGTLGVSGATTLASTLYVSGATTLGSTLQIGSATLTWNGSALVVDKPLVSTSFAAGATATASSSSGSAPTTATAEWYNLRTTSNGRNGLSGAPIVAIENYDDSLSDTSMYRMCLMTLKKHWRIPMLTPRWNPDDGTILKPNTASNIAWGDTWWPVSDKIVTWFSKTGRVLNTVGLGFSKNTAGKFSTTGSKRRYLGCAIFKKTGKGHSGWERVSNIAKIAIFAQAGNNYNIQIVE